MSDRILGLVDMGMTSSLYSVLRDSQFFDFNHQLDYLATKL
jgi:hypothetical protein